MNMIMIWTGWKLRSSRFIHYFKGVRIYQTIQRSVGSQQSKILERNAFRLLLSQVEEAAKHLSKQNIYRQLTQYSSCIFRQWWTLLNLKLSYFRTRWFFFLNITYLHHLLLQVNQFTCVMMSLFTVTNPLLNIIFSKDLTNSLKPGGRKESMRKKSSVFVSQSTFWFNILHFECFLHKSTEKTRLIMRCSKLYDLESNEFS